MNIKDLFVKEIIKKDRLHIILSILWLAYWFFTSFHQYLGFQLDLFFNYGMLPIIAFFVYRLIRDSRPSG